MKKINITALFLTAVMMFCTFSVFAAEETASDSYNSRQENSYDSSYYDDGYDTKYYAEDDYFGYNYFKNDNVYLCDESKRFSDEEKEQFIAVLQETADKIGFNVAVYFGGKNRSDSDVEDFADRGSRTVFGESPKTGTVFLYADLDGHKNAYDYMYSYREPFLYYTSELFGNRQDKILAAMQRYFPKGGKTVRFEDIYKGIKEYCRQLVYYKNMGAEEYCYYYNSDTGKFVTVRNGEIIQTVEMPRMPYRYWYIALMIGIFLASSAVTSIYFGVMQKYKFKTSMSASVYTSDNKIHMRGHTDEFLGTDVTRVRLESGGGGFGGGHHHSGGGRSGGGGGGRHR